MQTLNYEKPNLELLEIAVENGFAASDYNSTVPEYGAPEDSDQNEDN